ncbi:hypothetical protein H9Y04_10400 [Streptomyces sp. TRM66268-LWL]|uniref:Uncharacterized protein n=1 Tax=Streptomyces polyasparticus TaxID=2767826 RepID=A0ABR7SDC3_9ACTN|nr:hypothetical protein [Streptomyces polyasparticus]
MPGASAGYAAHELAKAFVTALTHRDPATRDRADQRGQRWRAVLAGMAAGSLRIGSRTPVAGLPSWVTPEIVRGGFATGDASAGGPLEPYERKLAHEFGVPAQRSALFAYGLTEPGLAWLGGLLDSGRFHVALPEEAALLTVAWLVRQGEAEQALELVGVLAPFADRLRFLPRPTAHPAPATDAVHLRSVGQATEALGRRGPHEAVETQREALTVWQPYADELLALWLETADDPQSGTVLTRTPDEDWHRRARELLRRYETLAAQHTGSRKRRGAKGNLGILRAALGEVTAGRGPGPRRLGLLRHACASMVRKRGLPGSPRHAALREEQARQAALPSHHALAQLVIRRLSGLPQDSGAEEIAPLVAPVDAAEAHATGLPAGAAIVPAVRKAVEPALSAPVEVLVDRGVVPSAEVLAGLVPQLVASAAAQVHPEGALRTLAAANYRAFRNRRSLLLVNLEHQVRVEELPWVRAVLGHRTTPAGQAPARQTLHRVAELAVSAFPGTLLPNPLVRELSVLARQCELGAPLVEELAADIFQGTFAAKFLHAADVAAELLGGSLYERYYGIDYGEIRELASAARESAAAGKGPSAAFVQLCTGRAGIDMWSVAANGMVIEQAQILTTHNLATLVSRVGIRPRQGWERSARDCFVQVCRITRRLPGHPGPLRTVKDAAYAWRQAVFFLSLCEPAAQRRTLLWLDEETGRHPEAVGRRLAPAVAGLRHVAYGGRFGADGTAGPGVRRFEGWSMDGHWLVRDPVRGEPS